MKLWVDDYRYPPEGWVWAQTLEDALDIVQNVPIYMITEMSLDHDLGGDSTTRPLVRWMAEFNTWPDSVRVHSDNPVGREWLEGMINRYGSRDAE